MKFDFKSIKFRTWLYFLCFSITILVILGFLLVTLIKPYYRDNRIQTVDTIVNTIEESLVDKKATNSDIERVSRLTMSNNVCALIFNEKGDQVYSCDSLGQLCMLDKSVNIYEEDIVISDEPYRLVDILNDNGLFSVTTNATITNSSMLLYGKKIKSKLSNYYLVINTPLEPIESYIDFILRQYSFISILIIVAALAVSFVLANAITSPIVRMKKEADKLAEGNYDIDFEGKKSYSEINELASTLDDATEKLSKIDELRKDLVANVSHDIKTPLTMIKAYAEMIKDISGDDPDKRNEHIDVILKETDYLSSLVNDMQELSKMQAGIIELNRDNFDLKETINDVISLLEHLLEQKNIDFKSNLSSTVVYADEIKISQVVYNFLNNAIKHTPEGNSITVNLFDDEDKVRVEVVDTGEGIKENLLPYIWDRYYKVDKNFARTKESTGLGLAIAKAILEAHNAKYGVISKENEGSTFWFELTKDYDNED